MDIKTVSVVIPAYNRERTIKRAICSALNQTYPVYEVIVVDDCSDDDTALIAEMIGDPRVRVVRNGINSGACKSRNTGIASARGDYIALLDSDDEWLPEKLRKQIDALEISGADVCTCRFKRSSCESGGSFNDPDGILPNCPPGVLERRKLVKNSLVSTQTIIAKKEVFDNYQFDGGMPRLQDYEWVIRSSERYTFYLVDDVLVNVFVQNNSITVTDFHRTCEALQRIIDKDTETLEHDPVSLSYLYTKLGEARAGYGFEAASLFRESLRLHFDFKVAMKFLLSKVGLYGRSR